MKTKLILILLLLVGGCNSKSPKPVYDYWGEQPIVKSGCIERVEYLQGQAGGFMVPGESPKTVIYFKDKTTRILYGNQNIPAECITIKEGNTGWGLEYKIEAQ